MKGIAAGVVVVVMWAMILVGAFLLIDGFLPSRSYGPSVSWVEVAMGVVGCAIGFGLRRVARSMNGQTSATLKKEDISKQAPRT